MKPPLVLPFLAVLTSAAVTQTFVVDASNGPGTNFTSIAAAVAAVPDGAVVLVRPGTYDSFAIQGKSLSVFGGPGVAVTALGATTSAYADVSGLSATQSVTLRQLAFGGGFLPAVIGCRDCVGTVVIDRCVIGDNGVGAYGRLLATNCDNVVVRDCLLETREVLQSGLRCFGSNMSVSGTTIDSASFALRLAGGRVHLTGCVLASTPGLGPYQTAVCALATGDLVLNGSTRLSSSANVPQLAAVGTGTVTFDPNTAFVNLANPAFDPGLTVTNRPIPRLTVNPGQLGGVASGSLAVPIGGTGALYVGFAVAAAAVPGVIDPIWLAPGAVLQRVGTGPTVAGAYAVPNAPWVVGVQVAWQGVVLDPSGAVRASNAAVYAH
ncbi:MAG: hypothetical protein KDE27_20810 [Planctomycetes bacterium]|nr:hypothetical protein [Planctomycetota bacterium]